MNRQMGWSLNKWGHFGSRLNKVEHIRPRVKKRSALYLLHVDPERELGIASSVLFMDVSLDCDT